MERNVVLEITPRMAKLSGFSLSVSRDHIKTKLQTPPLFGLF